MTFDLEDKFRDPFTTSKGNDKQFVVSGWKLVSTGSMPQNVTPNLNALSDVDVSIVQKILRKSMGLRKIAGRLALIEQK